MKKLYLVRHGYADWENGSGEDFDKPLTSIGKKEANLMGSKLFGKIATPDIIIASEAKRAKQTAVLLASKLNYDLPNINFKKDLYLPDVSTLLDSVCKIDDKYESAVLVSHNFGISQFAEYLSNENIGMMPTAAIVGLVFPFSDWKSISKSTAMLLFFDYPSQYSDSTI